MTSSVSGKRATAAPYAHIELSAREVATGFEPVCTALQAVASPLGHATVSNTVDGNAGSTGTPIRADDEIRTRDPHLGKVMRYHCATSALPAFACSPTLADRRATAKPTAPARVGSTGGMWQDGRTGDWRSW